MKRILNKRDVSATRQFLRFINGFPSSVKVAGMQSCLLTRKLKTVIKERSALYVSLPDDDGTDHLAGFCQTAGIYGPTLITARFISYQETQYQVSTTSGSCARFIGCSPRERLGLKRPAAEGAVSLFLHLYT